LIKQEKGIFEMTTEYCRAILVWCPFWIIPSLCSEINPYTLAFCYSHAIGQDRDTRDRAQQPSSRFLYHCFIELFSDLAAIANLAVRGVCYPKTKKLQVVVLPSLFVVMKIFIGVSSYRSQDSLTFTDESLIALTSQKEASNG